VLGDVEVLGPCLFLDVSLLLRNVASPNRQLGSKVPSGWATTRSPRFSYIVR
jgi:hypothetical protein